MVQVRTSKFSTDPVVHHPTRLAIMVHLTRHGGRDRFSTVCHVIGAPTKQMASLHCGHLEDVGYVKREMIFAGRGQPRTWIEMTPAGYSALARYRDAILGMFDGTITAAPRAVDSNSTEINAP
jgi:hypothetical protein